VYSTVGARHCVMWVKKMHVLEDIRPGGRPKKTVKGCGKRMSDYRNEMRMLWTVM